MQESFKDKLIKNKNIIIISILLILCAILYYKVLEFEEIAQAQRAELAALATAEDKSGDVPSSEAYESIQQN